MEDLTGKQLGQYRIVAPLGEGGMAAVYKAYQPGGVMLYEMATGRPPFAAETPMAILFKHIHDPLPPPRTINPAESASVERVILKELAKERGDRYQT